MFVEVVPSRFSDAVRKGIDIPGMSGDLKDACGDETLGGAIVELQGVCSRLLPYVDSEDLLLVFGESVQALRDAAADYLSAEAVINWSNNPCHNADHGHCAAEDKNRRNNRAVVLCKVEKTEVFERVFGGKEKQSGHETNSYQITWGEFEHFHKGFGDGFNHKMPFLLGDGSVVKGGNPAAHGDGSCMDVRPVSGEKHQEIKAFEVTLEVEQ